jgi:hypothetical protein
MDQGSIFHRPQEKGSNEWVTFDVARRDRVRPGMFRVEQPAKKQTKRGTVVPVPKYKKPHEIFPRPAH